MVCGQVGYTIGQAWRQVKRYLDIMFELEKNFSFEAGHVLPHHEGKCSRPHGHSYGLTVRLRSAQLIGEGASTNMVIDFCDICAVVDPMIKEYLDHYWLNDSLQCESPTAEFIARWIYKYLKPKLPLLQSISIHETLSASVTYSE